MSSLLAPVLASGTNGEPWWIALIKAAIIINLVLVCFAYLTLAERKVMGRMQLRYGPNRAGPFGLLQPIADMVKLIRKESFLPEAAIDVLYIFSPWVAAFTALGAERWRTVDTSNDPTGHCFPPGPSRAFTAPFPFQLVQGPDSIGILFEYQAIWRAIYMDGRTHPEDVDEYPYFMGHSIGRWEGDVLVVDTAGIDERSWLDTAGHEHSAKLRVTERFVKKSADQLEWTVTFDDPVFFTRPWSITRTFTRGKKGDRLLPYTCVENNKDLEHLVPNQPNLDYKHTPEPGETPKPKPPGR